MKNRKGALIDLDGVIFQGRKLISGANQTLKFLNDSNIPYKFITNTTRMTKKSLVNMLSSMGLTVSSNEIFAAPHAAIEYCKIKNYNSIALIDQTGILEIYNKLQLVPVAERVPLSNFFGILDRFNIGTGTFSKGDDFTIFSVDGNNFASMVCFESTFPHLSKRFVKEGAHFLIYVVNDGWYETAPEPQQHAKQAIFRAIETRRPVVRSANTGISMVIDQFGNIQESLELNQRGVIEDVTIFPSEKITFYVRYGDYLIYVMMIILLYAFIRSKIDEKKI